MVGLWGVQLRNPVRQLAHERRAGGIVVELAIIGHIGFGGRSRLLSIFRLRFVVFI